MAALAAALAQHRSGNLTAALAGYDRALREDPQLAEAHNNCGIVLTQLGRPEAALECFSKAIAVPNPPSASVQADAWANRGIALGNLGRFAEAVAAFESALAIAPNHAFARNGRAAAGAALAEQTAETAPKPDVAAGLTAAAAGDFAAALAAFDRAIAANPANAAAIANRGAALADLGRTAEALAAYSRALELTPHGSPEHAIAQAGAGRALVALSRPAEAIPALEAVRAAGRADSALLHALGGALEAEHRYAEASAAYAEALVLDPALAAAHYGRANALRAMGDPAAALAAIDRALALEPATGRSHNLRGIVLKQLGYREEALAAFDRTIALTPADTNAHCNRSELLRELDRLDEAHAAMATAAASADAPPHAAGQLLHLAMHLSDWRDHAAQVASLAAAVTAGTSGPLPFPLLALLDDPAVHRAAAASQLARLHPEPVPPLPPNPPGKRLRIGYFSADLFAHATMFLLADVLEAHDREQFEIVLFSYGPPTDDPWHCRAKAAADRFINVREMSDQAVAQLARTLQIDIAVDLKGLTGDARQGIFAARAAPLQVNWLGYPGTMPTPFIDYLVADPHLIPPAERAHFAEAVITLPDTYQPNCRIGPEPATLPSRNEHGLPETGFVFCCFNQNYKILPPLFGCWMRMLAAVPGSVLWLWVQQETARTNLQREAAALGIDPARLVFAALAPREEHLARLHCADLFLDTAPYGAHTSASDALRAGVPLLTCPGRSFASRVGASLLHAAGLPELVAIDMAEYERLAIALAVDPATLTSLRARLAHRAEAPLFAPDRFARNLEAAWRAIDARARSGLAPADIVIPLHP